MIKLIAGVLVGWLAANLVAGMRPVAWLDLMREQADKLAADFSSDIKAILDVGDVPVVSPRDWE